VVDPPYLVRELLEVLQRLALLAVLVGRQRPAKQAQRRQIRIMRVPARAWAPAILTMFKRHGSPKGVISRIAVSPSQEQTQCSSGHRTTYQPKPPSSITVKITNPTFHAIIVVSSFLDA
jgi:hypothetical protein